ncbi:hypothetical protein O3M35_000761 [Rhynocoris fuscipes]|uniref:Tetraspanin n=1 Tax=Rhynocoris fuscipes TaxID=488301 RepID=A0AAW1DR94_9HEMI
MQSKSVSPQTGRLKIGKKEEDARKEKLVSSLPSATINISTLSFRSKCFLKLFRLLLGVNITFSATIMLTSVLYAIYFNGCVSLLFGPLLSFGTKLFFITAVTKTMLLSLFGLFASTCNIQKYLTLYLKMAIFLLAMTTLFAIWFILHRKYDIDLSEFKSKSICTKEETECWGFIQKTFHCCGWEGTDYWKEVPLSCCNKSLKGYKENCTSKFIPKSFAYNKGCFDKINKYIMILVWCVSILCTLILIIVIITLILVNYIIRER